MPAAETPEYRYYSDYISCCLLYVPTCQNCGMLRIAPTITNAHQSKCEIVVKILLLNSNLQSIKKIAFRRHTIAIHIVRFYDNVQNVTSNQFKTVSVR